MTLFRPQFTRPFGAFAVFALVSILGAGSARAYDMNAVIGPQPGEVGTPCGASGSVLPPGLSAPIQPSSASGSSTHASVDGSLTLGDTRTYCRGGRLPLVLGGAGTVSFPAQGHGASAPPPTSNGAKSPSLPTAHATSVTPTYQR